MTTKTKVCRQNHRKIFDFMFSFLTPRVKVCIRDNELMWEKLDIALVSYGLL